MERTEKIRETNRKEERRKRIKYPPLIETCKKCLGCQRLGEPNFTGDKNCKYAEKEIWKQEGIWKKN